MEFQLIGQHSDVVNDISFDFYGRRFATCSSDKHIRIWDLKEDSVSDGYNCPATFTNGNEISGANLSNLSAISTSHGTEITSQAQQALQLTSFDIPSAHQNAIWRLSWAHPEFGQLLASCSDDHTICIWEEIEVITRGNNATKKSLEEPVPHAAPSPAKAKTAGGKTGGGVGAEGSAGGVTITGSSASNATHIASAAADGGATAADTDAAGTAATTGASGAAVTNSGAAAESKSDTATGKGEAGAAATASSVKSESMGKISFQGAVAKPAAAPVTPVVQQAAASRSRWTKKAQLSESKKAVRDVKFAPRHLGLMLASVSADGFVRIYEATDVFSLNIWQLQHTVQVEQMVDVLVVDIASSTSSSATGVSGTSSAATVPSSGPIFGGSLDVNTTQASSADIMGKSEQGLTCVSWNTCPFEPAKIAVGGYSSRAVVLSLEESKWSEECVLGEHSGVVHDIAWAPTMGRNYHQIATASREPTFRIHTLNRAANGSLEYRSSQTIESNSDVWRVAWNATGTVLATSSEDGTLALWRKDYNGEWKSVQTLAAGVINGNEETRAFYRI